MVRQNWSNLIGRKLSYHFRWTANHNTSISVLVWWWGSEATGQELQLQNTIFHPKQWTWTNWCSHKRFTNWFLFHRLLCSLEASLKYQLSPVLSTLGHYFSSIFFLKLLSKFNFVFRFYKRKNLKIKKYIFWNFRTNEDNLIVFICLYFLIENILPLRFYFKIKKV